MKNPEEVLTDSIKGGVTLFQLREKGNGAFTGEEKFEFAKKLQQICKSYDIPFIVNDDVELAIALNADGVHIGQEDEDAGSVRQKIGDKILGISAHNVVEAKRAIEQGADYIGVGPMFPTKTKKDTRKVKGPSIFYELLKEEIDIPMVGIGGITSENAQEVLAAGADGIAVISTISQAESPLLVSRKLALI
ncbi:thiamine phosphate synthase [Bacillus carboniphilus]|uniref:Thiamine-phosphate synthase n=2 Tax=Bacillus carboniphilus TaxID=86663 RepID=A0ABN0VUR1_9BACI